MSEALERGEAIGTIAAVQTSGSAEGAARVRALAECAAYPVRLRGRVRGRDVDELRWGGAVRVALRADVDWPEVRHLAVHHAAVIVSNTSERGYDTDAVDTAEAVIAAGEVPRSFPAKLTALLHARWQARPDAPLSLFPCELIHNNGAALRAIVCGLASDWCLPAGFLLYLTRHCRWANSLVDRIVSEPISPIGAVAEPYALWAVERQAGLVLPCQHEAIVLTDDLARFERLKLHILNLGHSCLAEAWLSADGDADMTVLQAMTTPALRQALEATWSEDVLPVFLAEGFGADARAYMATVSERFENPFLAHRLRDIAQDHAEKKRRRFAPLVADAERLGLAIPQTRLRAALSSSLDGRTMRKCEVSATR